MLKDAKIIPIRIRLLHVTLSIPRLYLCGGLT